MKSLLKPLLPTPEDFLQRLRGYEEEVVFLFDLDGTLADIHDDPLQVTVPQETLDDLKLISSAKGFEVRILSGRTLEFLSQVFGQDFKLSAEHGGVQDTDDRGRIKREIPQMVESFLESLCLDHEGSFTEKKDLSVGWHYRKCKGIDPEQIQRITEQLNELLDGSDFKARQFDHVLEILAPHQSKKNFLQGLMASHKNAYFVCFGDDVGEGEMFSLLGHRGVLVAVGSKIPEADYFVARPQDLRLWIKDFAHHLNTQNGGIQNGQSESHQKSHPVFFGEEY